MSFARTYASADAFLFASETDTYGQVVVEAQASGTPVVAAACGGPRDLIEDGRTGLLRDAVADDLAGALVDLASSPGMRRRISQAGLEAARTRTWAAALMELVGGYDLALGFGSAGTDPRRAPLMPVETESEVPVLATAA